VTLPPIDIYGVGVALSGPAALVEREVWPYVSMWPAAHGDMRLRAIDLRVGREARVEGDGYTVRHGLDLVASARDMPSLVTQLQAWLDRAVLQQIGASLAPVHAGVVAWEGGAILLPAGSGSGKTSLVAALIQRGARYYSDELALIDAVGRVLPYPRPLLVRDPDRQQRPVLAESFNARVGSEPLPIKSIVAVRYVPDERLKLRAITSGDAVLLLLRHAFVELPIEADVQTGSGPRGAASRPFEGTGMWRAIVRAADAASSYTGVRGDVAESAEQILALVRADRKGSAR
jgi:hypothetical protein